MQIKKILKPYTKEGVDGYAVLCNGYEGKEFISKEKAKASEHVLELIAKYERKFKGPAPTFTVLNLFME